MVAVPGLAANSPGIVSTTGPRLLLGNQTCGMTRNETYPVQFPSFQCSRRKIGHLNARDLREKHAVVTAGRSNYELSSDPGLSPEEPFWLALVKELIWSLKSLFLFLCEQPSQLKYIEWPGLQSTLRTATLTLVLVALLIVALTSVDTALSYVSRLLLRKTS